MTCLHPSTCRKSMRGKCKRHLLCIQCANRARAWDADTGAAISAQRKAAAADPEWRRKQSEAKKALWADPRWRAKWQASRKATGAAKDQATWNRKMREAGIPLSERMAIIAREMQT
jgi:hypothetical protein